MNFFRNLKNTISKNVTPAIFNHRILWIILVIFSVMGMIDIVGANIFKILIPIRLQWILIIFISAFKSTAIVIVLALCQRIKWLKSCCWLFISIYAFLCFVNFVCYELYEFGISHKMLTLMSETNPEETREFFENFFLLLYESFSAKLIITILVLLLMCVCVIKIPRKIFIPLSYVSSAIGIFAALYMISNTFNGKNNFSIFLRTAKNVYEVYKENRTLNSMRDKMQPYSHSKEVMSQQNAFNMIFIVGESADKSHMSLYGYPLQTTPFMDSIAGSLYVFEDALASSKHTRDNIVRLLTLKKDSDTDEWWKYPIIFDIFKAAGYKTFWISNQERSGLFSNASGVISSRADVVEYVGKQSSEDHLLEKYDEVLLPKLEKALADTVTAKWIGLHLYGSHIKYLNRYPADRQYFDADDIERVRPRKWMDKKKYEIAATYDNSIRYTDSVVGRMIKLTEHQSKPSVLIYLSDHGENVYDTRDYNGRDRNHVKVPLVIYVNEAYRRQNPEIVAALSDAVGRSVTTANLPFAIMTMSSTSCPDYDATSDFLSPDFVQRVRYVDNEPYNKMPADSLGIAE